MPLKPAAAALKGCTAMCHAVRFNAFACTGNAHFGSLAIKRFPTAAAELSPHKMKKVCQPDHWNGVPPNA